MACTGVHCSLHSTGPSASCQGHSAICSSNRPLDTNELPSAGVDKFAFQGKISAKHINELRAKIALEIDRVNTWVTSNAYRKTPPYQLVTKELGSPVEQKKKVKASEFNALENNLDDIGNFPYPISGSLNTITGYSANRNYTAINQTPYEDKIIHNLNWSDIVNKYNQVRADCVCNSDCACNAVCACHNDCACNYSGSINDYP